MNIKKTEKICVMQYSVKCKNNSGVINIKDFYTQNQSIIYENIDRVPICKHCMLEYVYGGNKYPDIDKMKDILRICDFPFFEHVWIASVESDAETVGRYFSQMQLNFKDRCWNDGDLIYNKSDKRDVCPEDIGRYTNSHYDYALLKKKWGRFSQEQLEFLEDKYKEWSDKPEITLSDLSTEKIVKRICMKEMRIQEAEERGESTDKLDDSLIKLMNNGKLSPKSSKEMNETEKVFGKWVAEIETYKPAEYFTNKDIYKDFDGIYKYFKELILRPLKNLLTGSRDFSGKYTIETNDCLGEVEEIKDIKGEPNG